MSPDVDDLKRHYASLSQAGLMDAAREYDSLTEVAQALLRDEFARRGLEAPLVDDLPLLDDLETSTIEAERLVTIRRYRDLSEAIVVRSMIESAGIRVYLYDENLVRLDWQISNFIGGIRLQVESGDEAIATELLDQAVPASFEFEEGSEFVQPRCPVCGSTDLTFQGSSRKAALASLYVLSVPLPLGPKSWLCNHCGTRWENTDDEAAED